MLLDITVTDAIIPHWMRLAFGVISVLIAIVGGLKGGQLILWYFNYRADKEKALDAANIQLSSRKIDSQDLDKERLFKFLEEGKKREDKLIADIKEQNREYTKIMMTVSEQAATISILENQNSVINEKFQILKEKMEWKDERMSLLQKDNERLSEQMSQLILREERALQRISLTAVVIEKTLDKETRNRIVESVDTIYQGIYKENGNTKEDK